MLSTKLSGYRTWEALDHADKWLVFPEYIGPNLAIDETSISQESNGTYEDLTARAAAIRDMDAIAIQPEAVSRDEFGRILKSNGNLVTIADDGMNVSFSERAMNNCTTQ